MEIYRLTVTPLKSNCYIVKSGTDIAVIDPGGDIEKIMKKLDEVKDNATVKYIIATHYHFDHTGAVRDLKEKVEAPFVIHEDDAGYLDSIVPDETLYDGEEIILGEEVLQVIHTPGHSAGSICLLGDGFIFTGDTLFQFSYGRTDYPGGDEEQMQNSLRILHEILVPGMTVYPGHGLPFPVKA
jgi:glyoxylase-like metal-dependent hydrolase (beta-lactamase superfamily II)